MIGENEMPEHIVALIGGAVAGAEAASVFAERGVGVVVFEQNRKPYGKIEDGLPRWHSKLRQKEYGRIRERLTHPNIEFVPLTRIGRDIAYDDLVNEWGFSAVLLANGAWRDRPLPVEGADEYVGKGLYYQNPFIYWFNHYAEESYEGPDYSPPPGTMIVGGGLASIDVAKAVMLETVWRALRKRGLELEMSQEELEHKGCDKVLAKHELTLEDLGVEPCTLYYRRRPLDMPLVSYREGATEAQNEKTERAREKLLNLAMKKYLFKFHGTSRPLDKIVKEGRLVGLRFLRTRIENRRVIDIPDTEFEVRAPLIISSIGSIPMPIKGIPMKGELYGWEDWDAAVLDGERGVFGLGNVITGKGNINVSRKHSKGVAIDVAEHYLGVGADDLPDTTLLDPVGEALRDEAEGVADEIQRTRIPMTPAEVQVLTGKVQTRQEEVGYAGDLAAWLESA